MHLYFIVLAKPEIRVESLITVVGAGLSRFYVDNQFTGIVTQWSRQNYVV